MRKTASQLQLQHLACSDKLEQAWRAISKRSTSPGPDGVTTDMFGQIQHVELARLHRELSNGQYRPGLSRRVWIPKNGGGERAIIVMNLRDRVALSACKQALEHVLSPKLKACTYAYRRGLGTLRAVRRLNEYREAGKTWVVRGDVARFFDSVSHQRLLRQLDPLVDRAVIEQLQRVLALDIVDGEHRHKLICGLPQGSPLSPLLSNVYLTPFDAVMDKVGGSVRFADDFAVACPSPSKAGRTLEYAEVALAKLGLELNEHKTKLLSFAQGFDFLGFTFRGRGIRIQAACLQTFKDNLDTLLSGQPRLREANDLIRGWRNYYQVSEVYKDFEALDCWLAERHGRLKQLGRLSPSAQRRTVALGGYNLRKKHFSQSKAAAPKTKALPMSSVTGKVGVLSNAESKPLKVCLRQGDKTLVELGQLKLPSAVARRFAKTTARARLYHQARFMQQLPNASGVVSLFTCAAALSGRAATSEAETLYFNALYSQAPKCDLRTPRGQMRRYLQNLLWCDLLGQGLRLGAVSGVPEVVVKLLAIYEPQLLDFALLRAARAERLRQPKQAVAEVLGFTISYRNERRRWRDALALEAHQLADSWKRNRAYCRGCGHDSRLR